MADISTLIQNIRKARFGRDVRESIAKAIEAMNDESSNAYESAITSQTSALESASYAEKSKNDAKDYMESAEQYAEQAKQFTPTGYDEIAEKVNSIDYIADDDIREIFKFNENGG